MQAFRRDSFAFRVFLPVFSWLNIDHTVQLASKVEKTNRLCCFEGIGQSFSLICSMFTFL